MDYLSASLNHDGISVFKPFMSLERYSAIVDPLPSDAITSLLSYEAIKKFPSREIIFDDSILNDLLATSWNR